MKRSELNDCAPLAATAFFQQCCGAKRWVAWMVAGRPYPNKEQVLAAAAQHWQTCRAEDYLQAFTAHPRIGAPASGGEHLTLARAEQAQMAHAKLVVAEALATLNHRYAEKFGYIFIIDATGKSAETMLTAATARYANDPATELKIAAAEQAKITARRLRQLLADN